MRDTSAEEIDPADEQRREQEHKQDRLKKAESLDAAAAAAKQTPGDAQDGDDATQQTWLSAFTQKLIDNVQISVENIHLRYEDSLSTPSHPFAAGITLASFRAVSTDANWVEAFISNAAAQGGVHKLASLDGLAVYFDTDASSVYSATSRQDMLASLKSLIASKNHDVPTHQYILTPISASSRLTLQSKPSISSIKTDAQVFFDEIGFVLDDTQYRDALSMLDLFHFYSRTHQYRKFRPPAIEFKESPAKARWKFALNAISSEVREKNRKWEWAYFKQRRDERKRYVELYVRATLPGDNTSIHDGHHGTEAGVVPGGMETVTDSSNQNPLQAPEADEDQSEPSHSTEPPASSPPPADAPTVSESLLKDVEPGQESAALAALENKLSYEDIRFFRSVAKARVKKDAELRKKLLAKQHAAQQSSQQKNSGGWFGWIWGGGGGHKAAGEPDQDQVDPDNEIVMTEQDKEQLNEIIQYDPSHKDGKGGSGANALEEGLRLLQVTAVLNKGSLALRTTTPALSKSSPSNRATKKDLISLEFDTFRAKVLQYPKTIDASVSLADFSVFDGATEGSVTRKVVRVKAGANNGTETARIVPEDEKEDKEDGEQPFLMVRFEHNPLDHRADTGLSIRMRHLEVIYHRTYVVAVLAFLTPPASHLESIQALISAAGETFEGIRRETRAGLEFALEVHKTIDVQVSINAPVIIIPERPDTTDCLHMILDAGHIGVSSTLASKEQIAEVQSKRGKVLSDEEMKQLEGLMYDEFRLSLDATQVIIGHGLDTCLDALQQPSHASTASSLHIIEKVGMTFTLQNAMVKLPKFTRFRVAGELPSLRVNISDRKYKSLMRMIDIAIPTSEDDDDQDEHHSVAPQKPGAIDGRRSTAAATDTEDTAKLGFGGPQPAIQEYLLDDTDIEDDDHSLSGDGIIRRRDSSVESVQPDTFYDAADDTTEAQRQDIHQVTFEFKFIVGELQASLARSTPQGIEKALAVARLSGFDLVFELRKYDMGVNIGLTQISLDMYDDQSSTTRQSMIDSGDDASGEDLVKIVYRRVQKDSPEYMTVFDGADQNIQVDLSTFRVHAKPEAMLALYDFIMTTFVPGDDDDEEQEADQVVVDEAEADQASGKIRIRVRLRSIECELLICVLAWKLMVLTDSLVQCV